MYRKDVVEQANVPSLGALGVHKLWSTVGLRDDKEEETIKKFLQDRHVLWG